MADSGRGDYPPIDQYGFISDTHTGALIAPDGAIEWLCLPCFDAGSVFARLLDRERGGSFQLTVTGAGTPARRYLPDTFVLASQYETDDATVTGYDFLVVRSDPTSPTAQERANGDPLAAEHLLVRLVKVTRGEAEVTVEVDARPDYARREADWRPVAGWWEHADPSMWLTSERPLTADGHRLTGSFRLRQGESYATVLGYGDAEPRQIDAAAAEELLNRTMRVWSDWSARSDYQGFGREQVRRSAMVLRGLAFDESGALLAAPTTSLPEELGGERNWDYRATWHRDAALLLMALFRLGHDEEGSRYMRFLLRSCAEEAPRLPPMAGIRGEQPAGEEELDHLAGYAGSRPVRVGNEAGEQTQLDTYGHVLDAALAYQQLTGALRPDEWRNLRHYVDRVADGWREPDHGIWEIRGPKRHYVNSKVMCWVCLDRGVRLAELLDDDQAATDRWRRAADELHAEVLERGFDHELGAFIQAYDSKALDASLLRIPLVGFLPGDDPRMIGTLDRIVERLGVPGTPLVYRYHQAEVDDGLAGGEGAFLLCTFELVSALLLAGRRKEAEEAFGWLCRRGGPLGLFSEEMAPDGTALGNFPQAFTHLALIEAAMNLDTADSHDALHSWPANRGSTS